MSENNFASDFEELRVWIESRRLVNAIYDHLEGCRNFGFIDQLQRASVSVMNNIAEGFDRGTKADFARFLDISKGSSGEVRSMLYLAEDRRYLTPTVANELRVSYRNLGRSIGAFAKSLRSKK